MALSLGNDYVVFSASTDVPKKLVPIKQVLTMDKNDVSAQPGNPAALGEHSLLLKLVPPYTEPIVVKFGSDNAALVARDAAYAAVLAAATSV